MFLSKYIRMESESFLSKTVHNVLVKFRKRFNAKRLRQINERILLAEAAKQAANRKPQRHPKSGSCGTTATNCHAERLSRQKRMGKRQEEEEAVLWRVELIKKIN